MVFIDDSPVERSLTSASLPEIAVPEFPDEPTGLKRWLLGEVVPEHFGKLRLTVEDRDKARQYRANSARAETASRLSMEEYLRSLEIKTTAYEKPASLRQRIAQLIQKTNQFNLTGRRYSEGEISEIYEDPCQWFLPWIMRIVSARRALWWRPWLGLQATARKSIRS